ncbi:LLM class flavin-dependent oxidoreductase [Streptomyces sp. NPDC051569]|uniref:LLM class flavin-dependent oxidoreductase n=1 Tax=Streptomyces sp. NPDC051569 TaxID=3365661 RepID=UPI00378CB9DB
MTDLRHELRFGAFLTPTAHNPPELIRLATLADEIGMDLVGIQDHPYQPSFLDTWTLLTDLAARTENITLFPDVANLPLRPPAVLARSAATLDILSGGRVELGLGAGAFWDGVVAMGGERRTPREAVDALEEAIHVIRDLWTPGSAGIHREGRYYSLLGARPGPFPVHPLGLWIGSYKKRMLELTARLGDGWLPSSQYASPAELVEMTAILDKAAIEAGRKPEEIQRIYNVVGSFGGRTGSGFLTGPPREWAEQLTELALELGVSGFVMAPSAYDAERDLRIFTEEVAPLVRAAVDQARGAAPAAPDEAAPDEVAPAQLEHERVDLWATDPLKENSRPRVTKQSAGAGRTGRPGGTGARLVLIHNNLRQEMQQIRDAVAQVAAGDQEAAAARSMINNLTMRQNHWTLGSFCAAYCRTLTTHHTIEDELMFPELQEKQDSLSPVLEQLEQEHEVIADVLIALDEALVALIKDDTKIGDVHRCVALLDRVLTSHLDYEEEELVEPLDRLNINV